MSTNPTLPRQIRSTLEDTPDALPLNDLLVIIDEFIVDCTKEKEPEVLIFQLQEDLHSIHHEVVDCTCLHQTEIFLAVLYHLGPLLPPNSVVSWFDLLLRPALREPKLSNQAVIHAKELIITALQKRNEIYTDKVGDFRRRLIELYLLDAFNDGSRDDLLEWAELNMEERQERTFWKHNLEDILVKFGNERPEDFLNELNDHFAMPSSRLQLFSLLNIFTTAPSFPSAAKILPKLPLMRSLQYSLFLDCSSTVCTIGISLIVKLLPFFAAYAREDLKTMLPTLLAILARLMCWKERPPVKGRDLNDIDVEFERELENEANRVFSISPHINWERLDMTFNLNTKTPSPSSRALFTVLYYLYPANLLLFLRTPLKYLITSAVDCPYKETWEQALDQDQIRRTSENLLREHNCHPLLVWRDATGEISEPEFWRKYDTSRIVSEAMMLDIRKLAVGIRTRYSSDEEGSFATTSAQPDGPPDDTDGPRFLRPIDLSSGRTVISLQDMINTTVALKSNLDLEVIQPSSSWSPAIFSNNATAQPSPDQSSPSQHNEDMVTQAISGLQRQTLLLRNDLNFELWLSRENAKHIGRLYQDQILMRTAEAERQGLYNKMRKYRSQANSLEDELREHKLQASNAKNKYADWNTELQQKMKELREEKKQWLLETGTLRTSQKETQALFNAQSRLLADATNKVFDLQTQKKENQHKIDRLRDYERQIEEHIKNQKMWDEDFQRFNNRENEVKLMQSQYKQMQMRLESTEGVKAEMEDNARAYRRQIQGLEARLNQMKEAESPRIPYAEEIATFSNEKAALMAANTKLGEENHELKEEVEELRAMVEILKGRRGLVSEDRSPLLII